MQSLRQSLLFAGNYKKLHTPDNENEVFDDEHNQEQVKDSVQNISPTDDKKVI